MLARLLALSSVLVLADGRFECAAAEPAKVEPLAGTHPLTWEGDLSLKMVDDLHLFADRLTAESVERRARHWKRDFSSREAYEKSIEPNRARLAKYLGVVGRQSGTAAERNASRWMNGFPVRFSAPRILAQGEHSIRVELLFVPGGPDVITLRAQEVSTNNNPAVIVVVDPAESIDQLIGWEPSTYGEARFPNQPAPRRNSIAPIVHQLLSRGCDVHVLRVLGRDDKFSTVANGTRLTNQPHREFVYRQAFEMGRHVVGYEIQAVLSLVDQIHRPIPREFGDRYGPDVIGIVGNGEGGLVALGAAALDSRIDVVGISGYFGPREGLAGEPIYRNIWGILDEFGDAELAAMIAPRKLVVEAAAAPEVTGPVPEAGGRRGAAPGGLPKFEAAAVEAELERGRRLIGSDDPAWNFTQFCRSGDGTGPGFSDDFVTSFVRPLYPKGMPEPEKLDRPKGSGGLDGDDVEKFLFDQMVEHTQDLVDESEYVRKDYWANADRKSRDPAKWAATLKPYRDHLYDEVLGRFDLPKLPPNARTRKIYDTPKYVGYEVVLDVFGAKPGDGNLSTGGSDVWAFGVLLVPKDLKPGEKRPVVVCQHGLEGRPEDTIRGDVAGARFYHEFAAKLADRGFVTFSPQNPYIGKNHFRQLVRKLNPLKKSLWSIIVPQHEQITDWLASLDFVDGERIGFYGLSYGGKTAMRVPALVERYCLSICSGDFNEWIRKCTSVRDIYSYIGTGEYEMFEFDLGHTFNYAEMAYLIAPRPFMVERGHRDGVGVDEWVSYEFAKVRMLYADLKIPERTEMEYFDGPHEIHAVGTFDFLHRHLSRPAPKE